MTPELDWLKRWSVYAPRSVALKSGDDGREFTYLSLFEQSTTLAHVLKERFFIARGDRVAVLAGNELEYITLFFALQRLGAILVPVNFRFTASEAEHIVRDCGAKLLIAQQTYLPTARSLQQKLPSLNVWNFDGPHSLSEVCLERDKREMQFVSAFEDPCMILYTSGTTGFPKGAVISNRMIFWNSINTGLRLNLTQNDSVLTFLPLFHTGGWNVLTTPCLHRGAKVVLLRKFESDLVLRLCESEKVSVLFGVPTTMDFLKRSPQFESRDLDSLRYAIVGGEPMPLDLIQAWETRGVPIRQGYGLTEFGPNVFSLNQEESLRKMGSIGFPNFYIEARVIDEAGRTLPAGQTGELVLRGPVAMSGYWNNEEATRTTLRNGWLHTGDLVRCDNEGYYFVVGRKKEMFISGGENVYPAEIEKVLRQFPGVREAAVIGIPHPKWGECGRAFLSFEGAEANEAALRAHCLNHLAKFKVPAEFVFLKDLPKTESGKIAKKILSANSN